MKYPMPCLCAIGSFFLAGSVSAEVISNVNLTYKVTKSNSWLADQQKIKFANNFESKTVNLYFSKGKIRCDFLGEKSKRLTKYTYDGKNIITEQISPDAEPLATIKNYDESQNFWSAYTSDRFMGEGPIQGVLPGVNSKQIKQGIELPISQTEGVISFTKVGANSLVGEFSVKLNNSPIKRFNLKNYKKVDRLFLPSIVEIYIIDGKKEYLESTWQMVAFKTGDFSSIIENTFQKPYAVIDERYEEQITYNITSNQKYKVSDIDKQSEKTLLKIRKVKSDQLRRQIGYSLMFCVFLGGIAIYVRLRKKG